MATRFPHGVSATAETCCQWISGGPILQPMLLPLHGAREAARQGSKVAVVEGNYMLRILQRHGAQVQSTGRLCQNGGTINVLVPHGQTWIPASDWF